MLSRRIFAVCERSSRALKESSNSVYISIKLFLLRPRFSHDSPLCACTAGLIKHKNDDRLWALRAYMVACNAISRVHTPERAPTGRAVIIIIILIILFICVCVSVYACVVVAVYDGGISRSIVRSARSTTRRRRPRRLLLWRRQLRPYVLYKVGNVSWKSNGWRLCIYSNKTRAVNVRGRPFSV